MGKVISRSEGGLNELALFAGAGGGILGGKLLGWRTVCAVEWEPYAAGVLIARQNDGILPPFPIWDDVRTFYGRPWRGIVDVVSGGFPCQDISAAGRGAGLDGERSGLWREMARIIGEVRPRFAFVENSPVLTSRGLGTVLGDLAALGYDTSWGVLSAADAGAPHLRERIWILAERQNEGAAGRIGLEGDGADFGAIGQALRSGSGAGREAVADTDSERVRKQPGRIGWENGAGQAEPVYHGEELADTTLDGREQGRPESTRNEGRSETVECGSWWAVDPATVPHYWLDTRRWPIPNANGKPKGWAPESRCKRRFWVPIPYVGRVAHGVAARVDRLKAIGNGQVPVVARLAWRTLGGSS